MSENHGERIAKLEVGQENTNNRLNILENDRKILYTLTVVAEQNSETIKLQQKYLEKMEDTFNRVNDNLTLLNVNQEKLSITQDNLSKSVIDISQRVNEIEEEIKEDNEKDSIRPMEMVKEYLKFWILLPISIVIWWLKDYLNFK